MFSEASVYNIQCGNSTIILIHCVFDNIPPLPGSAWGRMMIMRNRKLTCCGQMPTPTVQWYYYVVCWISHWAVTESARDKHAYGYFGHDLLLHWRALLPGKGDSSDRVWVSFPPVVSPPVLPRVSSADGAIPAPNHLLRGCNARAGAQRDWSLRRLHQHSCFQGITWKARDTNLTSLLKLNYRECDYTTKATKL